MKTLSSVQECAFFFSGRRAWYSDMFRRRIAKYVRFVLVLVVVSTVCSLMLGLYSLLTIPSTSDVKRLSQASRKDQYSDSRMVKVRGVWYTNGPVATNGGPNTSRQVHSTAHKVDRDPLMQHSASSLKHPPSRPQINFNEPIKKTILSNISTIFSDDYVPNAYKTMLIDNSTIHFCQIVAKTVYALEVDMFVRSVLLHARRSNIFFHFIATEGAENAIPKIFDTLAHGFVDVRYEIVEVQHLTDYLNNKFQKRVKFIHPWSGIYGTGKIFMYDLLPNVNKCVVIDSDTLFGIDPAFLWNEAKLHLKPPVTLAATWSPTPEHFNSGVMVHDLERMRKIKFSHFITMEGCKVFKINGKEMFRCEHDQHLLLHMLYAHRELFHLLNVSWNLDNCSSFKNFTFDTFCDTFTGYFFGVAHFCCFPATLKYVYENGTRYIDKAGLINYFNYLKALDFSSFGEKKISRVRN